MEEIKSFLTYGISTHIFQAERNLLIWEKVAKHSSLAKILDEKYTALFVFLQQSAQTNFVLYTAKIFDSPSKKYPTRCLLSLFELLESKNDFPKIDNINSTIELLRKSNVPDEISVLVKEKKSNLFVQDYLKYLRSKYDSANIKSDIDQVKFLRDKYVAHNENMLTSARIELQSVRNLLKFATEILEVFGQAYFNQLWTLGNLSINSQAEKNSKFVDAIIKKITDN